MPCLHFWKKWVKEPDAEINAESIGTNFKSWKWKSKKLVCPFLIALFYIETYLIKKRFFLISGPRVPSFYIQAKSRFRVTTVHLLQCKTNFFIHLCFWEKNLRKIQEHPSWKASINIKKKFFSFVYRILAKMWPLALQGADNVIVCFFIIEVYILNWRSHLLFIEAALLIFHKIVVFTVIKTKLYYWIIWFHFNFYCNLL